MKNDGSRRLLQRFDIAVITAVLAVAALAFFCTRHTDRGTYATVTVNGETERVVDLAVDAVIRLDTEPCVTLIVEGGSIRFADALCPDKICERTGKLKNAGDTAACIPAKTVVTVTGDSDVDAVVY